MEKEMATTPVFLPREAHGQRSLVSIVHGVAKSWTRLSNFTSKKKKKNDKSEIQLILR